MAMCKSDTIDVPLMHELLQEDIAKVMMDAEPSSADNVQSLCGAEAALIERLLREHTPEEVCVKLGISRTTLWRKRKRAQQTDNQRAGK